MAIVLKYGKDISPMWVIGLNKDVLSDGAYRLYKLLELTDRGSYMTDTKLSNLLKISDKSVKKYKRELKELNLIEVKRNEVGEYIMTVYVNNNKDKR